MNEFPLTNPHVESLVVTRFGLGDIGKHVAVIPRCRSSRLVPARKPATLDDDGAADKEFGAKFIACLFRALKTFCRLKAEHLPSAHDPC